MVEEDFEIISVSPTEPPEDMEGSNWYFYVIGQGSNRIEGYRRGSPKAVRAAIEEIVTRLNERRIGKRKRVHLTMSSAKKTAGKS